jgi:hypothetical protein
MPSSLASSAVFSRALNYDTLFNNLSTLRVFTEAINTAWQRCIRSSKRTHTLNRNKKPISEEMGFLGCKSLTMSYFHTGIRTIIGAEAFHGPVRDGKEWYHLAMVIRHNLLLP